MSFFLQKGVQNSMISLIITNPSILETYYSPSFTYHSSPSSFPSFYLIPPTPRLTQFDMPEDDQEAESCRLTLSRDGSPFGNGNVPVCHGCTGCQGSCHQCTACHYNFNGIYGCTTGPYGGNVMYSSGGGSILGVRGCGTPGYSAGSQLMNEFNMYSQQTLPSSR